MSQERSSVRFPQETPLLIKPRNVILILILLAGIWALRPTSGISTQSQIRLGTDPRHLRDAPASIKYKLRVHAGSYLPGLMPDNVGKPLGQLTAVASEFEQRFPDTRIEFIGVPATMREWLVTQLSSGQAPDIVAVNVEEVWQDVQKNWYIPLNQYLDKPNPFVAPGQPGSVKWWDMFKYPIPTRGTCAPDGNFYCITLDMIETGIFYNKDIFDRLGLHEPSDWTEYLKLQQSLRAEGYIPTLVDRTAFTDWGVDLIFYQLYRDIAPLLDLRYDPNSGDYLKNYLDWDEIVFLHSKGFFSPNDPRWVQTWRTLKQWRGHMVKNLGGTDMLKAFVTQKGATLWAHSGLVNRLARDPDVSFKWGVFYLPPIPKTFNSFANGYEQCVIGGSGNQYEITNTAIGDTDATLPFAQRIERSERLKRVVAFLQFLSTPRNSERVVNEIVALVPNIKGTQFHPELAPFDGFLQRPYSMTKWYFTFDLQFDEVFARTFDLYLNAPDDQASEDEFLDWMQRNLDTACERITRRKALDLKSFEQKWRERTDERRKTPGLPPELTP